MTIVIPGVVSSINLTVGGTAHIEVVDENAVVLPVGKCTLSAFSNIDGGVFYPASPAVASWVADSTGFVITGLEPGLAGLQATYTDGTSVFTYSFGIVIPSATTQIGVIVG